MHLFFKSFDWFNHYLIICINIRIKKIFYQYKNKKNILFPLFCFPFFLFFILYFYPTNEITS